MPSDLDQIPKINNQILVNLDSFNLEATPVTNLTGATWTELRAQTPQPGNIDGNELYFAFLDDVAHQYPNGTNNLPLGFNLPDRVWPGLAILRAASKVTCSARRIGGLRGKRRA